MRLPSVSAILRWFVLARSLLLAPSEPRQPRSNEVTLTRGIMRLTTVVLVSMLAAPSVWAQQTTLTLSTSANPVVLGQPLTITATVAPTAATGKVTFYYGTTVLGTRTLSGGQATLTTSLLPAGTQPVKAYYAGSASQTASTSTPVAQTVMTLPANGFKTGASYPVGGGAADSILIADFNGDGKADCVVSMQVGGVSVLLGNGDGTLQTPITTLTVPGIVELSQFAAADFNGDGKTDLAFTSSGGTTVSVMLGKGDGTFQSPVTYAAGSVSIAVGDFNGDGIPDLATTGDGTNVDILLGNGDGTFQPSRSFPIGFGALAMVVADFNGDGKAWLSRELLAAGI